MGDSYVNVADSFPTPSGTTVQTVSVTTHTVGAFALLAFSMQNAASGITWTNLSGTVNAWHALVTPISPSSGALTGYSMGLAFAVVTTPGTETVSLTYSIAPTAYAVGVMEVGSAANSHYAWFVDQSAFESFNTTPGATVSLNSPPCAFPRGECGIYMIRSDQAVVNFGGWKNAYGSGTGLEGILTDTDVGSAAPTPQWVMGAAGSLFALGVVLQAVPPDVPMCIPALGVM